MRKLVTLPRLMCLTTILAAGPALMAASDVANANGLSRHRSGHIQSGSSHPASNAKRNGFRPAFVIRGQPANIKEVFSHRTDPHGQFDTMRRAADCKTNCGHLGQTTTQANHTQPATAGNANPTARLNGTYGTVTTSNGVTKPIFNDNRPATPPKNGDGESFIHKTVKTADRLATTATLLPPAAGVVALPVATGVAPVMGTFVNRDGKIAISGDGKITLNPILGPPTATLDYLKDANSQTWGWISSFW
jgi:hypothetical protein